MKLSKYHKGINVKKTNLINSFILSGNVFDIGCGNGLYGLFCKEKGLKVTQLDIEDRRDNKAKKLDFIKADLEDYELINLDYANVLLFDVLEHIKFDKRFLKKTHKIMKKGSRIFISVPNSANSILEKSEVAHFHFTDKTHYREYSDLEIKEVVEQAGFKIIFFKPHFNSALVNIPNAMATDTFISKFIAKSIGILMRVLRKIRLLEDKVIADWFLVAEK